MANSCISTPDNAPWATAQGHDARSVHTHEDFQKTREELERLQIQTIYSLVEDVEITVDGRKMNKKFLYATVALILLALQCAPAACNVAER